MKTSHPVLRVRLFCMGLEACRAEFLARARPGSSQRRAQARKAPHLVPQTGFTLIELLVVMAVIAVLAILVFPAIKSVTLAAKSAKTVSHLRQTGNLIMIYAGDNNNCLPHAAVWERIYGGQLVFFSRSLAEATVPGFAYGAAPCTGDRPLPPIFYDPCLAGNSRKQHPMGAFAVNRSIVTDAWWSTDPKTSLLSISRPSQKVIFCSIGPGDAQYCGGWLLTGADFVANGMSNNGYPDPRNAGGAASLFADGHVEKLDVAKMDQETRRRHFLPDP